ncbi:MAG: penicillin-binding protein 2 [Candidatus Parcubacteria bacterium]|nr:penicillin-binding protein 2 [Candidatus Parcubacteria bacterium]
MLDLTRWKNRKKVPGSKSLEPRIKILAICLVVFGVLIIGKLFDFQVLKFEFYAALASDQHEVYKKLFPSRGSIYVKDKGSSILAAEENLYPLSINKDYNLVYGQPKFLEKSPEEVAGMLAPILEPDEKKREELLKDLVAKLSKQDDPYEPLAHKVEDSQAEMINNLKLKGIKTSKETFRYYPENNIGANVLGYVGFADDGTRKGYYGIEGYFNKELAGRQGEIQSEKDITGTLISVGEKKFVQAKDGDDIVLTIDKTVQFEVCSQLNQHAKVVEADSAAAIVMNPQTGEIIAMCSWPDFDPNDYGKVKNAADFKNRAVYDAYEPGSIFKPVTMAAALDLGKITPETTYIDEGAVKIDEYTIRNSDKQAHGKKTMTQVLESSLNLGTIFAMRQMDHKDFRKYVEKFGFGKETGIELTESEGNIAAMQKKGEIFFATASFGQGITATPLQMVQAFSVIANGGKLVKPYIVEEVRKTEGIVIKTERPEPIQIISSRTATLLTGMLVSVIKNGQGKKAAVPGYYMAGKSGTAQIANYEAGGYYANKTNHSFIGFAPIRDPAFVMIIKFENPKKGSFAESTTMPLFSRLAKFLLDYYHVVPDDI